MVYTVPEIAEKLKMDAETIRRYIKDDKLEAKKMGNRYRITEQQFQEFMREDEKIDLDVELLREIDKEFERLAGPELAKEARQRINERIRDRGGHGIDWE